MYCLRTESLEQFLAGGQHQSMSAVHITRVGETKVKDIVEETSLSCRKAVHAALKYALLVGEKHTKACI